MWNLPVLSEGAFPFVALGFGVIGFVALKIWGWRLDHSAQAKHARASARH
jgi:hypothetical protein